MRLETANAVFVALLVSHGTHVPCSSVMIDVALVRVGDSSPDPYNRRNGADHRWFRYS